MAKDRAGLLRLTAERIDFEAAFQALQSPDCGAQIHFHGVVRNNNQGKAVSAVVYEAFEPLALEVLKQLEDAALELGGPLCRIAIIHRTGRLEVGEISTFIGVAAPHRDECYKVSRFLLEELKRRLPIWKKEEYLDGQSAWLEGVELEPGV